MIWLIKDNDNTVSLSVANDTINDFTNMTAELWKTSDSKESRSVTFVNHDCRLNKITFIINTTGLSGEYNLCLKSNAGEIVGCGVISINTISKYTELENGVVISEQAALPEK